MAEQIVLIKKMALSVLMLPVKSVIFVQRIRGQAMITDLVLGVTIFTVVLVVFYRAEVNVQQIDQRELADMILEAQVISDLLVTSGTPTDWTNNSVIEVGVSENHRINETKLSALNTFSYNKTRSLFHTKYDYYFYFETNAQVNWITPGIQEGIGKPGVITTTLLTDEKPKHIVRITRFVVYKGVPTRLVVVLWS